MEFLTNEKLAEQIREGGEWDMVLLETLCERAGMMNEWLEADAESFEEVVYRAAEKLGVEI